MRILLSNNHRIAFFDAEPFQESVMALRVYRTSWRSVQHGQLRGFASERFFRVLSLQDAGLEVIRGQGCVYRIRGIGRRVEGDDENPFIAGFFDRPKNSRRVRRRDQDTLDSGADEILDGCDLPFVISIEFTKSSEELCSMLFGFRRRRLSEFDEVWINFGLGN